MRVKHGLVLEGGAMRGMFTAGVLDVMMENGIQYDPSDKELIKKADEKYPLPKSVDFRMHD